MMKKILCLAMMALMVLGTPMTALASGGNTGGEAPGLAAPDWTVTFSGSKIKSSLEGKELQNLLSNAQPGDEVEVFIELKNDSKNKTEWYMKNVLSSLKAGGGAYTYILTYISPDNEKKELYNSRTVAVEPSADTKDQLSKIQKTGFYLDRLDPGETARVTLYMKLDGETVTNVYQDESIEMDLNFTVEEITQDTIKKEVKKVNKETVVTYTPPVVQYAQSGTGTSTVSTGDSAPIMVFSVLAFVSAVALIAIASKMMVKRRNEKGEQ